LSPGGISLDFDTCYRAVLAPTTDSTGVSTPRLTSTVIYCRPICPARTPARRKMRFYAHPGAAEAVSSAPAGPSGA